MDEPLPLPRDPGLGTDDDTPCMPHSFHESLERFGGAWLVAGSATVVAMAAVSGRLIF